MERPEWVRSWRENASAFDRVRSVAMSMGEPRTAGWIAERSRVAETTARDHLERLAEMGMFRTETENGTTRYSPDPAYVRFREIQRLTDEHTARELAEFAAELKEEIEGITTEYEASSPQELRTRAAEPETDAETARTLLRAADDWEHYAYRLSLFETAIKEYAEYRNHRPTTA